MVKEVANFPFSNLFTLFPLFTHFTQVAKWEDSNNDIIVLAKHMCSIMTDMTDFIKGRGRIKTTDDVISSAQEISKAGTKLDQLARRIADRCPESSTKSDLLAYLQRIILYCHQLSITSKVRTTSSFSRWGGGSWS